jgi:hypothetical protein
VPLDDRPTRPRRRPRTSSGQLTRPQTPQAAFAQFDAQLRGGNGQPERPPYGLKELAPSAADEEPWAEPDTKPLFDEG